MGTAYSVKLVDPPADFAAEELGRLIVQRLEQIEQRFSTYRPSSELSTVNQSLTTDWIPVSAELCAVVESALELSRRMNGAFDVTVGPLVLLWGFGPAGERSAPPDENLVAEARNSVGFEKVSTDCSRPAVRKALPGVELDLSAIAKGFAVDEVAHILDEASMEHYLVEIGGELCARGHNARQQPWSIAIEKPDPASRTVETIVRITDRCMATSGDYRNFFTFDGIRYSHTVDPSTGRPVTHDTTSVSVIATSAAEADGLATGLLVLGAEDGRDFSSVTGIDALFLVRSDDEYRHVTAGNFAEWLQ